MSLRIKDWSKHYEMGDFKKTRHARWYPKSTRQDGKSYKRLLRMPKGHLHYLAFTLMEQIAAKAPVRGTLSDDNGDLTPEDMALITEAPAEIFAEAIKPLLDVGWLEGSEPVGISPTNSETPGKFPPRRQGRQDKEEKTGQDKEVSPPKQTGGGDSGEKPVRKSTPWGLWIDLHRARNLADPIALGEDLSASKQLAKAIPDLDEMTRLMACYLDDPEPFLAKNGHALRHLPTRINAYRNPHGTKEPPIKKLSELPPDLREYFLDDSKP